MADTHLSVGSAIFFYTFLSIILCLTWCQNTHLAGEHLIISLFDPFQISNLLGPESTDNIHRHALGYFMDIRVILTFPNHYIVPCSLCRSTFPCLVKHFCGNGKVRNFCSVVLIGSNTADQALELNSVNVFHKILSLFILNFASPHLMRA